MQFFSYKRSILLSSAVLMLVVLYFFGTFPTIHSFHGEIMGTTYHVSYVNGLFDHSVKDIAEKVHGTLFDVDRRMSTYKNDSEVMQFNRSQVGQPFHVSADIVQLVMQAEEIFRISNGLYDITIGPLVNLWGFGPSSAGVTEEQVHNLGAADKVSKNYELSSISMANDYPKKIPSEEDITNTLANVGFQYLKADLVNSTLTRLKPLFLDLSSIAKGYGVDQVAALLRGEGINDYLIEVGGEIIVKGKKPNKQPWRVAIMGPEMKKSKDMTLVEPGDKALATSGNYLNFFEVDGNRYSHTINPTTGWPVPNKTAEVSVIAETSALSDALATMLMALGGDAGLELANRLGIAAHFTLYTESGIATIFSEAFKPYLVNCLLGRC